MLDRSQAVATDGTIAVFGDTVDALHEAAEAHAPPFDVLVVDEASEMKLGELVAFCRRLGEEQSSAMEGSGALTAMRGAWSEVDA